MFQISRQLDGEIAKQFTNIPAPSFKAFRTRLSYEF